MVKNKKILEDHKRIGKKLVPPMIHAIPLQETNYVEELLPEILWMELIHEDLGYHEGIDLIRKFVKLAYDSHHSENYYNFSIASNLKKLTVGEIENFVQELIINGIYLEISELLAPLIYFYKDSPFSFLNKEADLSKDEEIELLKRLKVCIENIFNRYGTPSVVAQLNVFYTRVIDGKHFFAQGIEIPDFNAIIDNPASEEAQSAAAFVRNSVKSEYMLDLNDYDSSWSKSFWNESYQLDDCEYER